MLLEPTLHVGGMATEGGIGLRDGFSDTRVHDPRNSQIRWGVLNALHYGLSDGAVWQPDNYVGEQSFLKLLNESGVEVSEKMSKNLTQTREDQSKPHCMHCT